jgi:hypothetical protein
MSGPGFELQNNNDTKPLYNMLYNKLHTELRTDLRAELKNDLHTELRNDLLRKLRLDIKNEVDKSRIIIKKEQPPSNKISTSSDNNDVSVTKNVNNVYLSNLFGESKDYICRICSNRAWGINLNNNHLYCKDHRFKLDNM